MLVCGGGLSKTAEILHLPLYDNDKGVWTLLTQKMACRSTYLANFDNRIVAVGESLIILVTKRSKQHLLKINCLHLRQVQKVRSVDINLHFHTPGKNSSINRSLRALFFNLSLFLPFRMKH